jgi:plasmid stabilization system protein ParE
VGGPAPSGEVTGYLLTEEAQADLGDMEVYFERIGSTFAETLLEEMAAALDRLVQQPEAGHARVDLTARPLKFWRVRSYYLIYNPATRPLHIIRILHTRRDIAAVLR